MTSHPGDTGDRRFTDREMKLIFQRAGEADVSAQGDQGHTLAELQEIARQVGLDPADVARAASTISAPQASNRWLGAPVRFHASRTLDTKLTDDEIAEIAHRLREATGLHGELRVVPGGAEWRARSAAGLIVVDFTAKGTGTRIDLMIARLDEALLTFMGAEFVGIVTGVAAGIAAVSGFDIAPLSGVAVGAIAAIGVGWAGTRMLWSRAARRWAGRTNALMESITEAAKGNRRLGPP